MKEKEDNLDKESKLFLESLIESNPNKLRISLSDIKNLRDSIPKLNYLVREGYICEQGEVVDDFHYGFTRKGLVYISSYNYAKIKSN